MEIYYINIKEVFEGMTLILFCVARKFAYQKNVLKSKDDNEIVTDK